MKNDTTEQLTIQPASHQPTTLTHLTDEGGAR